MPDCAAVSGRDRTEIAFRGNGDFRVNCTPYPDIVERVPIKTFDRYVGSVSGALYTFLDEKVISPVKAALRDSLLIHFNARSACESFKENM